MTTDQEQGLIQHAIALHQSRSTSLGNAETRSDTQRYVCKKRFQAEQDKLMTRFPFPLIHSAELKGTDVYKAVDALIGNLIVSRDQTGKAHVFHNICRHRGAQLVSDTCPSSKRITCPYHAWSYTTDGQLASVPSQKYCFPNLDKSANRLIEVPCIEKHGFVWVVPANTDSPEETLDALLAPIASDLESLGISNLTVHQRTHKTWKANWKILAEGGIETYHFAFAHRDTIGPSFLNNTAVIDALGTHLRIIMPTKALLKVAEQPTSEQSLRACSHILYLLFPNTVLLVQHEYVDWITFRPITHNQTEISITSLVPETQADSRYEHWQRNHSLTVEVLREDFEIGESLQASMATGALPHIQYGRNEWALKQFNEWVDQALNA